MAKETTSEVTPQTKELYYAKLHTALFVPGVTTQTNTTLDAAAPGGKLKMYIDGNFLSVTMTHAVSGRTSEVFTPLTNVICLAYR